MTLLRKTQSEGTSYLELAQFIRAQGDAEHADADLAQLFRRVAFNVAIGNRDDHLRNHGFVLGKTGWRLAPAFDVNPNIDKAEHVLNIDDVDNRPNLQMVLGTAAFYGLGDGPARQVVEEVAAAVDVWQEAARRAGIAGADIALTAGARGPCRVSCSRTSRLKLFHVSVQHRRHHLGAPPQRKRKCQALRPCTGISKERPRSSASVRFLAVGQPCGMQIRKVPWFQLQ